MKHNSMKKRAEKTRERTAKATKCVLERKFQRKTSKSLQKFTVTKIKARREKNANKKFRRKGKNSSKDLQPQSRHGLKSSKKKVLSKTKGRKHLNDNSRKCSNERFESACLGNSGATSGKCS